MVMLADAVAGGMGRLLEPSVCNESIRHHCQRPRMLSRVPTGIVHSFAPTSVLTGKEPHVCAYIEAVAKAKTHIVGLLRDGGYNEGYSRKEKGKRLCFVRPGFEATSRTVA